MTAAGTRKHWGDCHAAAPLGADVSITSDVAQEPPGGAGRLSHDRDTTIGNEAAALIPRPDPDLSPLVDGKRGLPLGAHLRQELSQNRVSTRTAARPGQGCPDLFLCGLSRDALFFLTKRLPQYPH